MVKTLSQVPSLRVTTNNSTSATGEIVKLPAILYPELIDLKFPWRLASGEIYAYLVKMKSLQQVLQETHQEMR